VVRLQNTIIAGNHYDDGSPNDVFGAFTSLGGNVIGVVLNNVDVRSDSQYQYYTSYYTYYAPAEAQVGPPSGGSAPAPAKPQANAARGNDSELY
jgi:hypothetical protein